jgi:hypothetical protein
MAQTPAYRAPRLGGHPDLNGIWQAMNTANWDLLDHPAQPAPFATQRSAPAGPAKVSSRRADPMNAALQKRRTRRMKEDRSQMLHARHSRARICLIRFRLFNRNATFFRL